MSARKARKAKRASRRGDRFPGGLQEQPPAEQVRSLSERRMEGWRLVMAGGTEVGLGDGKELDSARAA